PGALVGGRRRPQALLLELRQDEPVDGVARPALETRQAHGGGGGEGERAGGAARAGPPVSPRRVPRSTPGAGGASRRRPRGGPGARGGGKTGGAGGGRWRQALGVASSGEGRQGRGQRGSPALRFIFVRRPTPVNPRGGSKSLQVLSRRTIMRAMRLPAPCGW